MQKKEIAGFIGHDDMEGEAQHLGGFQGDEVGFLGLPSISKIESFVKKESNPFKANPFKVVESIATDVAHLATGAIKDANAFYQKVTPSQLKSVLRWTPLGLALRGGAKIAPETLKVLGQVAKWSPFGMVYRGVRYELPKVQALGQSTTNSAKSALSKSPYGTATRSIRSKI